MKAFAVDLGGTHITVAVVEDRQIVASQTIAQPPAAGLRPLLPLLAATLRDLSNCSTRSITDVAGIALGFCGIVDSRAGRVQSTNGKYPDAAEIDFHSWSRENFDLPLRLENDARMALMGEHYAGAAEGFQDVAMVTLGTGIGSAVMIEGKLLQGKHGQAGSLGGHVPVVLQGRACTCGGEGCAESEASGWALPRLCQSWANFPQSELAGQEINFANLFRCAASGDPIAKAIQQHCMDVWVATGVALVHAYDPELLIFGGGVMRSAAVIVPYLQARIPGRVWTPWGKVQIRSARPGNESALLGAIPMLSTSPSDVRTNVR